MMQKQEKLHTAIQENDFQGILCSWDYFLSFYFATYKRTYARFGSWYFHQMKNLESYFPGLKVNLSVQAQGQYHLRTAVEQTGEQTLIKMLKPLVESIDFQEIIML